MADLSLSSKIVLNNGVKMPVLGLGVYQVTNGEARTVVKEALDIGYRHIDTAAYYHNERGVGQAIKESERLGRRLHHQAVAHRQWLP